MGSQGKINVKNMRKNHVGSEIISKVGSGSENKSFLIHNTAMSKKYFL
jgi:hypothetical protein